MVAQDTFSEDRLHGISRLWGIDGSLELEEIYEFGVISG